MSFGFAVGDFIAVWNLASEAIKSFKGAPEGFKSISNEVLSLQAVLQEINETLSGHTLSISRHERLATILRGCRHVLEKLKPILKKYESLGSLEKKFFDRVRWEPKEIAELRHQLTSNITLLTAFIR
jgi:N-terminal domain on NACHT_NTPase and P-loop NTPases